MPEPSWTAADQAELDLLLWALVEAHAAHKERCPTCITDGSGCCRPLMGAIRAVVEWRDARARKSRAAYLRACQDFEDWAAA